MSITSYRPTLHTPTTSQSCPWVGSTHGLGWVGSGRGSEMAEGQFFYIHWTRWSHQCSGQWSRMSIELIRWGLRAGIVWHLPNCCETINTERVMPYWQLGVVMFILWSNEPVFLVTKCWFLFMGSVGLWVGLGPGSKFSQFYGLGWSFGGLGWVKEIGPTDNSGSDSFPKTLIAMVCRLTASPVLLLCLIIQAIIWHQAPHP